MLSFSWISSCDRNGEEDIPPEDPNTKKVRFKESNEILEDVMVVEPSPMPSLSWKDLLVGKETIEQKDASGTQHVDDSFSLLEQDVKKPVVNGILSIDFSESGKGNGYLCGTQDAGTEHRVYDLTK